MKKYSLIITYSLILLFGGVIIGQYLTVWALNKNLEAETSRRVELSIENSILRKKLGETESLRAIEKIRKSQKVQGRKEK